MKEAIILAGGFGTRLRHVVSDVPKPMAPVNGRPFLAYLVDYLRQYGYNHIVLSTGYLHEVIENYFGTGLPTSHGLPATTISYACETSPLGTGGGILNALQQCHTDIVTVLNGDTMFRVDYHALEDFFERKGADLSLILRHVDDTTRYGAVHTNPDGRISAFVEKAATSGPGLINGGIYRLNRRLFTPFQLGTPFSFEKDLMEQHFHDTPFFAFPSHAYFIDIGIPEDYARAQLEATICW